MKKTPVMLRSTVVAGKDQISADLSGEAAILHLKTGVYYSLNAVGKQILDFIRKPQKVSDVLQFVLERYQVDPDRCESDLLALLGQLAAEDLIQVKDDPAA